MIQCRADNLGEIEMGLMIAPLLLLFVVAHLLHYAFRMRHKDPKTIWQYIRKSYKIWLILIAVPSCLGFLFFGAKPLSRIMRLQRDIAAPSTLETAGIVEDSFRITKTSYGIRLNGTKYYIGSAHADYDLDYNPIEGARCAISYFPNSHYIWSIHYLIPLSDEMEALFSDQEDIRAVFTEALRAHPVDSLSFPPGGFDMEEEYGIREVQYLARDDLLPYFLGQDARLREAYGKYDKDDWRMQAYYDGNEEWYVVSFIPKGVRDAVIFLAIDSMTWLPEYLWCSGSAFA